MKPLILLGLLVTAAVASAAEPPASRPTTGPVVARPDARRGEPGPPWAVTGDAARAVVDTGRVAIGGGTLARVGDRWPEVIVVRLGTRGLEHLTLKQGDVALQASVLSHSGHRQLQHVRRGGKEGPDLNAGDPWRATIRAVDADGRTVDGLPPAGGGFEVTIPRPLLDPAATELYIGWIDFYR
jgi:hypothetical protein